MTSLLRTGNIKLGNDIATFSIPARSTCPGRSPTCDKICYAAQGYFHMPSVKQALTENEASTHTAEFVNDVVMTIRLQRYRMVRWHVSGDFYSAIYVRKVIEIALRVPQTKFLIYTRSWREANILGALFDLAALPNVYLWLSADRDTGEPPMRGLPFAGVAYLAVDDRDVPGYAAELVFREKQGSLAKFWETPGRASLVCPAEQGTGHKMTCSRCRYCFSRRTDVSWKGSKTRRVYPTLPPLVRAEPGSSARKRVSLRVVA